MTGSRHGSISAPGLALQHILETQCLDRDAETPFGAGRDLTLRLAPVDGPPILQGFVGGLRAGLATGIGLQNVPEGLAVAAGLTSIGYAPTRAFLLSLGTGVLEAFGALFGAAGASVAGGILPVASALAARSLLFVIASESIPEAMREETKVATTFARLAGFLVMMTLDIALA